LMFFLLSLYSVKPAHSEEFQITCLQDRECRRAFERIMQYPAISGSKFHYHYSHPRKETYKSGAESLLKPRNPKFNYNIQEGE
jgi:hypothetical protein